MISAQCVARDLHTIASGPLERTCWRQLAALWGDCKKSRIAPLNAIIIIIITKDSISTRNHTKPIQILNSSHRISFEQSPLNNYTSVAKTHHTSWWDWKERERHWLSCNRHCSWADYTTNSWQITMLSLYSLKPMKPGKPQSPQDKLQIFVKTCLQYILYIKWQDSHQWSVEKSRWELISSSKGDSGTGMAIPLRNLLTVKSEMTLDGIHKGNKGEEDPEIHGDNPLQLQGRCWFFVAVFFVFLWGQIEMLSPDRRRWCHLVDHWCLNRNNRGSRLRQVNGSQLWHWVFLSQFFLVLLLRLL